jgi:uncharacterized protein DUF2442
MVAVTHAEALQGHRLRLRFDDGSERIVDLSDVLWGEMGEPLRDPEYFSQVRVDPDLRTVVWPNGFDLDPDVLHGDHEPVAPLDSGQVNGIGGGATAILAGYRASGRGEVCRLCRCRRPLPLEARCIERPDDR